ncbi:MAG: ATP-dependent zinc protease family protein [Bacteroidia bacterium]
MKAKKLIGRSDKVDLPELGLFDLYAKIDTGAYTSAIHCHNIKVVNKGDKKLLHFILLDPAHPAYNEKPYYFEKFSRRTIKNSFGNSERRYIIKTVVEIFGKVIRTEFSLSNRGNLKFPVLLGRKFIQGRFYVDVSVINISFRNKSNSKKND